MEQELKKISDYWKETYSSRVEKYRPFEISADFRRYASMFSLGNSYLYIVNLHNFQLEYVSESVAPFVDKPVSDLKLQDLLQTVVPEEIENIQLKGRVVSDFYTSFLKKEEVLSYKNMFTYHMKDASGNIRTMLYQAIPLSVLENGMPEHVLCIQTDVSHLKVTSTTAVSFINMDGGKCYFNVDISTGKFNAGSAGGKKMDLSEILSEREKQIVIKLSRGLNADQIANELNISPHTVKTHRKNILQKSQCTNTTELVAKCLTYGIISPGL